MNYHPEKSKKFYEQGKLYEFTAGLMNREVTMDIDGRDLTYADMDTHHGLQCNHGGGEPEHEQIKYLCHLACMIMKEVHRLNGMPSGTLKPEDKDKALRWQNELIGSLMRSKEFLEDSDQKRDSWTREAKKKAGFHYHTSFDEVWAEALQALKEKIATGYVPESRGYLGDTSHI